MRGSNGCATGSGRSRLPSIRYPIDQTLAAAGAPLYATHCLNCHADNRFRDGVIAPGTRVGQVVPIGDIGTDRHRLDSYTDDFAANQYALYPDSPYRFTHFRKTEGYANHPLDGIWLRGPFLHNGSVPTLRALLDPPEVRPKVFYRGYDVFDQKNVGFVSDVPAGRRSDLHDGRHDRARVTATADTSTARRSPTRTRPRSSST